MINENIRANKDFDKFSSMEFFSGNSLKIENTPENLVKSEFHRTNSDLIATTPEGKEIVFVDYFSNFEYPLSLQKMDYYLKVQY